MRYVLSFANFKHSLEAHSIPHRFAAAVVYSYWNKGRLDVEELKQDLRSKKALTKRGIGKLAYKELCAALLGEVTP
jgi:hypothetical protein